MRLTACFVAAAALLTAAPADAQNPPAAPNAAAAALAGPFEISNADHDQICNVTLKADAGPGGLCGGVRGGG